MIVYEDVFKRLSDAGWSTYRLRKDGMLSEGTMTRLRNNQSVTMEAIDTICRLCKCQPGDILRYKDTERSE